MLSVAICDDNHYVCGSIERMIEQYEAKRSVVIQKEMYFSGEKLLQDLETIYYDIIILDIELSGRLNGIDVGIAIRKRLKLNDINIIFVSAHSKYAMELFKVRPLNFLIKQFKTDELFEILDEVLREEPSSVSLFSYKIGNVERKTPLKDIMYFSCRSQKVCIHTPKNMFTFYGTIGQVYEKVQEVNGAFIFCYRSFIVNYAYIACVHANHFELVEGTMIPIGQNKKAEAKRLFFQYERGV